MTTTTPQDWLTARRALLAREKELTALRDDVARQRRELPWVPLEQQYVFDTEDGPRSLAELFDGASQLIVYHFMFGPDWDEGCPSCSFWIDAFDGVLVHLAHRDIAFAAVSRAPLDALQAYRRRMGWNLRWVSSEANGFNVDYGVSFEAGQPDATYNYAPLADPPSELPGLSVFAREDDRVFHTYSCYSRGLDGLNSGYQLMDLTPRGRDEDQLPWSMAWLHRHDAYPAH